MTSSPVSFSPTDSPVSITNSPTTLTNSPTFQQEDNTAANIVAVVLLIAIIFFCIPIFCCGSVYKRIFNQKKSKKTSILIGKHGHYDHGIALKYPEKLKPHKS